MRSSCRGTRSVLRSGVCGAFFVCLCSHLIMAAERAQKGKYEISENVHYATHTFTFHSPHIQNDSTTAAHATHSSRERKRRRRNSSTRFNCIFKWHSEILHVFHTSNINPMLMQTITSEFSTHRSLNIFHDYSCLS